MTLPTARFDAAATRFRGFFEELNGAFMERADVLQQIALGLLGREHVLLAGPPGTAKSLVASSVFKRILCEETGRPSLYARQITESTVQTDLIGPVDFKNLMETGRTTHFTDEGMLGAAHAFLDEVFDGRDMLLRSALNVLQERELKQGSEITKGRIECALMTSNRYVSDVIEQSRDTLLAFLDRIAFVGFVPRGFADPANLAAVLRRTVGGERPRLDALLTLQDVDVLQTAVEGVWVAPEICDAVAKLLETFDAEVATACRADPAFSPTRYISTRTAVRCCQILRAIVVYDRIFRRPARSLEVVAEDLVSLRLHLLLSGPAPADIEKLLAREVDPAERRQLVIMRTEREIFDACIEKVGPVRSSPRPRPEPSAQPAPPAPSASPSGPAPAGPAQPAEEPWAKIDRQIADALQAGDHGTLVALARSVAEGAREGNAGAEAARAKLATIVAAIGALGVRAALGVVDLKSEPLTAVRALVALAAALEDGTASLHPTASWVEARALALIHDLAASAAGPTEAVLSGDTGAAWAHADSRLAMLEALAESKKTLTDTSSTSELSPDDGPWREAVLKAEVELAAVLAKPFCESVTGALGAGEGSLSPVLDALKPELARLDTIDARMGALAARPGEIKKRAVGPRVGDLVRAALLRGTGRDRAALVTQIRGLLALLGEHGLSASLEPKAWLTWTAEALVKNEPAPPEKKPKKASREAYLALRGEEQRTPITYTLAEVALLVAPATTQHVVTIPQVAEMLEGLPAELKDAVIALDVGRADRSLSYLERWWHDVEKLAVDDRAAAGIFRVVWDDAALARVTVEARLLADLLPSASERAQAIRGRVDALTDRIRAGGVVVLERRADKIWHGAVQGAERK